MIVVVPIRHVYESLWITSGDIGHNVKCKRRTDITRFGLDTVDGKVELVFPE